MGSESAKASSGASVVASVVASLALSSRKIFGRRLRKSPGKWVETEICNGCMVEFPKGSLIFKVFFECPFRATVSFISMVLESTVCISHPSSLPELGIQLGPYQQWNAKGQQGQENKDQPQLHLAMS